ncbi:MAG: hypothetical protein AB7F35_06015 [Acetobacteraceae bacterium]
MELYPAVVVHGITDARAALRAGRPVTLLSAPGAALHAGCLWWRALVRAVRVQAPEVPILDVLDCADGSGQALAALRVGVTRLVLWPGAPGWAAVEEIASREGGFVLAEAPSSLDMAAPDAPRRLDAWLQLRTAPGDRRAPLG